MTSTASMALRWVFAHRAIWLRLFPIRETCRVRSRSTSAAGAVQVRVCAIARRISAESGTPAAFALARQSADSSGVRRTATMTGRRLAIAKRRHGGKGGDAPARAIRRSAGLFGFEGAESLASPWVIPRVRWLSDLSRVPHALRRPVPRSSLAAVHAAAEQPGERSEERVQTDFAKRGQRRDGARQCPTVQAHRKPEWRPMPSASRSMDASIGHAVGWINLTACNSSGVLPRLLMLPFTLRWPEGRNSTYSLRKGFQSSPPRPRGVPEIKAAPHAELLHRRLHAPTLRATRKAVNPSETSQSPVVSRDVLERIRAIGCGRQRGGRLGSISARRPSVLGVSPPEQIAPFAR